MGMARKARSYCLYAAVAAATLLISDTSNAFYIGPSYLQVDGISGAAKQVPYKDWIRAESRYWNEKPELPEIRGIRGKKNDLLFTGPVAPEKGASMLAVSVDKSSPALQGLMDRCHSGKQIPEVKFAESSEIARHPQEHGPRPSDIPEYYEYVLKDVTLTCPVVEGAPEQAFGLHFSDIQWLNYHPQPTPREIKAPPAKLQPAPKSGTTKVFVLSWFAAAVDNADDQCRKMNTKPTEADYYALMSKERAAAQHLALAEKGGVDPAHMQFRGPDEMNVCLMPGIVADPGHEMAHAEVVRGFDLDGNDGSGQPAPGTRAHKNFTSPDGRHGIDNQLFTVEGCVEGFRRKGFLPMIFNEGRQVGRPTALLEISGIDDERNDDDVTVTIFYSDDDLARSPGKVVIPDYTFRVSNNPEYTQDFARFHGKIADGVLTTDPISTLHFHEVTGVETTFMQPRLRLEIQPDGKLKGLIGGYLDWRKRVVWEIYRSSDYENTIGFQCPAIYNAIRRAADGLQDPVTGEFNGISAAFEIEGVPSFIPPEQQKNLLAQSDTRRQLQ